MRVSNVQLIRTKFAHLWVFGCWVAGCGCGCVLVLVVTLVRLVLVLIQVPTFDECIGGKPHFAGNPQYIHQIMGFW